MTRRFILVVVVGCIALGGLFAPRASQAQDEATVNRIEIAMTAPATLDPLQVSRFDEDKRDLVENLFIGLTRFDARRGEVVPALATEWQVSPDGLVWTFTLREDVQWMQVVNGTPQAVRPVNATDVVFAIQRACDPNRPKPLNANMAIIAGCSEIMKRQDTWLIDQALLDSEIGVKALDAKTVEFRLLFPSAFFLTLTAMPEFRPLPADHVPQTGNYPLAATDLLTSGAWVVTAWDGQHMMLNANPEWKLEREGNLTEIDIRFDLDAATIATRLDDGSLAIGRVPTSTATSIMVTAPDMVHTVDSQPLTLIGFSFEYELANNPLVRQALAVALDREALATQLSVQSGITYASTNRFTPRNVIASPSVVGVSFDPTQAQTLMAQAGYPNCANFPLRLSLAVTDDDLVLGQSIIDQWHQNLGCTPGTFELVTVTRQTLVDYAHTTVDVLLTARSPIWLVTWSSDYPDANSWVADALHCQWGFLRVGRVCDNNDAVLDRAGAGATIQNRITGYSAVETSFFGAGGSFPVIPLAIQTSYWVQQPTLSGVPSYGPFQFDRWILSEE